MKLKNLGGISLIHPMWDEENRFQLQLENWENWDEESKSLIDITIIDDHSLPPVRSYIGPNRQKLIENINIELSIYRILDNLKWNTPGALNLGVTVAPKPWVLFMDSDCLFNAENIKKVLELEENKNKVYKFKRWRIESNREYEYRPLTCTMLIHKKLFWKIRFDEDFTGEYSGGYGFFDNHFDRRLNFKRIKIADGIYATEYMHDIVGRVERDHNQHHKINKEILGKKRNNLIPVNKQILNFAWDLDYEYKRI